MERENRIIQQSLHLFLTTGIKGVSMDDVAQHLEFLKKHSIYTLKTKKIWSKKASLIITIA